MRAFTKAVLTLGFAGAMAVGTVGITSQTMAQGIYLSGPGVEVEVGRRHHHRHRYYDAYAYDRGYYGRSYSWNGCPRYYTIQDGVCKPYRGY